MRDAAAEITKFLVWKELARLPECHSTWPLCGQPRAAPAAAAAAATLHGARAGIGGGAAGPDADGRRGDRRGELAPRCSRQQARAPRTLSRTAAAVLRRMAALGMDAGASTGKGKGKASAPRTSADECEPKRLKTRSIEEYRFIFGETTGDPTLYDRMPPENRAAVHAMIDAKTAELEEADEKTRQQEERRFRETQAQLAFGPTLQNDDEEGELDLELDEEIRLMAFSLDAVVFSTDPIGKNADGVLQYARRDYGVLRSLDHETLLKVMGSGDVQMGQLMVNLWYLTVRDLQRVGVEVCIVQDGALMDIVHALGQPRPDKDALVDNDREGTTLLDCFTHPPGMAPTTPLLNDPRLRTHIFTDDPEFGAYSSEPTFEQTDSEWIASGATSKAQFVVGLCDPKARTKALGIKEADRSTLLTEQGEDVYGEWTEANIGYVGFYQTDLRGTGHENALSQVGVQQKGAEARSVPRFTQVQMVGLEMLLGVEGEGSEEAQREDIRKEFEITDELVQAWEQERVRARTRGMATVLPRARRCARRQTTRGSTAFSCCAWPASWTRRRSGKRTRRSTSCSRSLTSRPRPRGAHGERGWPPHWVGGGGRRRRRDGGGNPYAAAEAEAEAVASSSGAA